MNVEVFAQDNAASLAMVRAVASVERQIRSMTDWRTADQLPEGECAVKVAGEWYGFGGYENGRMYLYAEGFKDPFLYGPFEGQSFDWRPLIGGIDK